MREGSSRRRVMAAAALATAITAVLVPSVATTAAPEPRFAVQRAKLADAIADEKRAIELLKKRPPRIETAVLQLQRSRARLDDIRSSGQLPTHASNLLRVAGQVDSATGGDLRLRRRLSKAYLAGDGIYDILYALEKKQVAMELLQQPATAQGPQCGDRIDNDGDGTVDARHDSGCASKSDATEQSASTCSLGYTAGTPVSLVQGTCSGPFAKLELTAPTGVAFDTGTMPTVQYAQGCRYASERRLDCVMSDGVANPRHRVSARFRLRQRSVSRPRVLIRDFRGAGRTWPVAPGQASAAPYLRFKLSYTHTGRSHVCASIEADSGAFLKVTLEGPNGLRIEGTLQLKKKETKTATGSFSFPINEFGTHRVTIVATAGGKSVTRTQTIEVTGAPGDARCSASGAPPP